MSEPIPEVYGRNKLIAFLKKYLLGQAAGHQQRIVATTLTVDKAGSSITQEDWIGLSFATYWQDYDNSADYEDGQYMKDSLGFIHLRGIVEGNHADVGTTIATLPAGYRPSKHCVFGVRSADGDSRVNVNSDGTIVTSTGFTPGDDKWLSLAAITFDTR